MAQGRGGRRAVVGQPMPRSLNLEAFDGGWNPRDAVGRMALNESPDCLNVTISPRGKIMSRLGYSRLHTSATMAGPAKRVYYSRRLDLYLVQVGASLYRTSDWQTFTLVKTFTTVAMCDFTDYQTWLVVCHPVDGLWTYDGATMVSRFATGGVSVATWQDRVWMAGAGTTRLWFSQIGVDGGPTGAWTQYVDIRDVDEAPLTAVGAGEGMDQQGRPTLLVAKERSCYRVHNSTTGAYTTLDADVGCVGSQAAAARAGVTAFMAHNGIYVTDGVNQPKLLSAKLEPLFTRDEINMGQLGLVTAGAVDHRIFFSLPRAGQLVNTLSLECDPASGWIVPHSYAFSSLATDERGTERLLGAHPTVARVYQVGAGGSDDGAPIVAHWDTPWVLANSMYDARAVRLLLQHHGGFTVYVRRDFQSGQGETLEVTAGLSAGQWGTGTWNDPGSVWGPSSYEEVETELWDLGVGRSFRFRFAASSTDTAAGEEVAGGNARVTGAWGVAAALLEHVPLGLS